jgi:hypothetical protein
MVAVAVSRARGSTARYLKATKAHGSSCVGTKLAHTHSMGAVWPVELGDVRRPTGQWREAVRTAGVCRHGAWHRPMA